jgi:hypothetical protein
MVDQVAAVNGSTHRLTLKRKERGKGDFPLSHNFSRSSRSLFYAREVLAVQGCKCYRIPKDRVEGAL